MDKVKIKKIALDNGFKLKQQPDGKMDLNPYVYEFAKALIADVKFHINELEEENDEYQNIITRQRMKLQENGISE